MTHSLFKHPTEMLRVLKTEFVSNLVDRFAAVENLLLGDINQLRLDVVVGRLPRFFFHQIAEIIGRQIQLVGAVGQIALAWVLAQKPWIVPIPGTTKISRLTENNGAATITLSPDERQSIETASASIHVVGARYTEQMEKSTGL